MQTSDSSAPQAPDATALGEALTLCTEVLPVWARQLDVARQQAEGAVTEMLGAFAEIGPHLDRAERQSVQISQALAQGSGGVKQLAQACEDELTPVMAGCTPQAQMALARVLDMIHHTVDALEQIALPFERETQLVSQQVDRMYRGFQYQDRINQMMGLVLDDIQRLQTALQDPGQRLNPADWLQRLQAAYVMAEQHQQHADAPTGAATADDDTTFF